MMNLPYNDMAEKVLLKLLMDKVPNFDNQNSYSLGMIIMGMAGMGCCNKAFWKLIEEKLITEELYRYMPLNYSIGFLHTMALAEIQSPNIFST